MMGDSILQQQQQQQPHIWLRAERRTGTVGPRSKKLEVERRSTLAPQHAAELIRNGFNVTVEECPNRIFPTEQYRTVGCNIAPYNTWHSAPTEAYILGLRTLPDVKTFEQDEQDIPLKHKHIFFGHAFNSNSGSEQLLTRFSEGNGALLDLEHLFEEDGKRSASFGSTAGFVGLAAGILAWCRQVLSVDASANQVDVSQFIKRLEVSPLVETVSRLLRAAQIKSGRVPRILIVGNGICGSNAASLATDLGLENVVWTRQETADMQNSKSSRQRDLLEQFDILVNAVRINSSTSPLLSTQHIHNGSYARSLSVIVDISCDIDSPNNALPIYEEPTSCSNPVRRIVSAGSLPPIDLIAIPTLASVVPRSASLTFSSKLLPRLLELQHDILESPTWRHSYFVFRDFVNIGALRNNISPVELPSSQAQTTSTEVAKSSTQIEQGMCTVPLLASQQRLLSLMQLHVSNENSNALYNVGRAFELEQDVRDLARFNRSVTSIIRSNQQYCTFFIDSKAYISASTQAEVRLSHFAADSPSDIQSFITTELETIFDVSQGPLLRVSLLQLPNRQILNVVMHELIAIKGEDSIIDFVSRVMFNYFSGTPLSRASESQNEPDSSLTSTETTTTRNFWADKLDGSLHVLQIPTDFPRPAFPAFSSSVVQRPLCASFVEQLNSFALARFSQGGCDYDSVFSLVIAAFKVLLFRFTGEEDVIIGTTAKHVHTPGTRHSFLPLRTELSPEMSFEQVCALVEDTVSSSFRYKNISFSTLLACVSNNALELSDTPLFQVTAERILNLEVTNINGIRSALPQTKSMSPYDISLQLCGTGIDLHLQLVFRDEIITATFASEILSQMELLLTQAMKQPDLCILRHNLRTNLGEASLPNPTEHLDGGWEGAIHDVFARNATNDPERLAVFYEGLTLSYGELERLSNQLANYLIASGLARGDVVALYGHRSIAVVVAIMGIFKAGCAYTMLDPAYPDDRTIGCLGIAKPRGWIQIREAAQPSKTLLEHLISLNLCCIFTLSQPHNLMGSDPSIFDLSDRNLLSQATALSKYTPTEQDEVAVITFTSGSTGLPKGVMGRHGPLTHFYPWMKERFSLHPNDRYSMCSGIAHDPLQRDIFTPLFFGSPIYIPTQEQIVTPGGLAKWMKKHEINVSCLTPAMGQLLITIAEPITMPNLKVVLFVGDCLIKRDVFRLRSIAPAVSCINMYGSTETQRAVGYFEVPGIEGLQAMNDVMPAGHGMKDVSLILLNASGTLAGVGEAAEIYVRSPHISKGYIGLDELTSKKFLLNKFADQDANAPLFELDRMYRTGDLGRYDLTGCVHCLGRADDQVKIRGFRIELGEINAKLSQFDGVQESVTVVKALEHDATDKRIVSYIILTETMKQTAVSSLERDITQFLRSKLPTYMIPSALVFMDKLPLTPNGKINRRALPAPALRSDREDLSQFIGATQQHVARIWADVLETSVASPQDNFFELGGHSLAATQVALRIQTELEVSLPINILFTSPTVAAVAEAIDTISNESSEEKLDSDLKSTYAQMSEDAKFTLPSQHLLPPVSTDNITSVFITGATGFLGVYLLHELLLQSRIEQVYCLIRGKSVNDARMRLEENMKMYGLWLPSFAGRLVVVLGDLAQKQLGISQEEWNTIGAKADLIIHNGALVHWLYSYEQLRNINVCSTQEVLRLATEQKAKRVAYVSTTGVYSNVAASSPRAQSVVIPAVNALSSPVGITDGYSQSKWVSDQLVMAAAEVIPVSVFRPSYVTGDSATGKWNTDDFLCRLTKGCLQLGSAPVVANSFSINMTPVNMVSSSIIRLCFEEQATGNAFNITNPQQCSMNSFLASIAAYHDIPLLDYNTWRSSLLEYAASSSSSSFVLQPILAQFTADWGQTVSPSYCSLRTQSLLSTFAEVDIVRSVLPTYFTFLYNCGYFKDDTTSSLLSRSNRL